MCLSWKPVWRRQTTPTILNAFLYIRTPASVFRTPVSARSYRASAFLLDLLLFCQANKFIHSFKHAIKCMTLSTDRRKYTCILCICSRVVCIL